MYSHLCILFTSYRSLPMLICVAEDVKLIRTRGKFAATWPSSRFGNNGANVVLEALANTPPIRPPADEAVTSMRVYCPALRHLDCSNNHDVKGGPLVRLVKLRLTEAAAASAPGESGADAPVVQPVQALQSLNIDGCPAVDPNVLPWLRERVPKLSSVYMSKKAAGWKR